MWCARALAVVALVLGVLPSAAPAQQAPPPAQAPPTQQIVPPPLPPIMPEFSRDEMERRARFDLMGRLSEQGSGLGRYRQARQFADCAQRISPDRVAALLEKPVSSAAERRAANSLMRFAPGCLGQSVVISIAMLRGAAAEAVLEGYQSADPPVSTSVNSARIERFFAVTPDTADSSDVATMITRFTQCQVVFAPGLARKLVAEVPESAAEKELRGQLAAATALCGKADADSPEAALTHRSYLAEALYHWTRSSGEASHS